MRAIERSLAGLRFSFLEFGGPDRMSCPGCASLRAIEVPTAALIVLSDVANTKGFRDCNDRSPVLVLLHKHVALLKQLRTIPLPPFRRLRTS